VTETKPRWWASIRARLLVANALLVIVPLAGLAFARTFERELLRSEEEGMVALATALAAGAAAAPMDRTPLPLPPASAAPRSTSDFSFSSPSPSPASPPAPPPPVAPAEDAAKAVLHATMTRAAAQLGAQVRLLDREGRSVIDTGPEAVEKVTAGRVLLSSVDLRSPIKVGDPGPPSGVFAERPEVRRALDGRSGRFTRISSRLRSVRLFVAEPARTASGEVVGVIYVSRTTYPVLVSLYRIRNGLERVMAGSLAVALVVAVFLGLTISRPLARLTRAAGRIAAGERGVALKLSGRDEVGVLARAFDAMAHELDARLGYISELAANVSHEFKTPLASIRGAAELLADGAADEPAARDRFLGNILADTERLDRLVSRLLELSRVEAHEGGQAEPLDYEALVASVVERYAEAGQPVELRYEGGELSIHGHPDQLAGVLGNLLDNALRFSPAGRPVTVRVAPGRLPDGAPSLVTEVVDQGEGISPANLARLWTRFFTTARERGGTGLGLSIVKAVVEGHGGEVSVESAPGKGSTFRFTLPASPPG
jgi:two-component system sensor histidine kinase ChvG